MGVAKHSIAFRDVEAHIMSESQLEYIVRDWACCLQLRKHLQNKATFFSIWQSVCSVCSNYFKLFCFCSQKNILFFDHSIGMALRQGIVGTISYVYFTKYARINRWKYTTDIENRVCVVTTVLHDIIQGFCIYVKGGSDFV